MILFDLPNFFLASGLIVIRDIAKLRPAGLSEPRSWTYFKLSRQVVAQSPSNVLDKAGRYLFIHVMSKFFRSM